MNTEKKLFNLGVRREQPPFCVGINWSAIRKKRLFGLVSGWEDVDLDISVATFNTDKKLLDLVYYEQLRSRDGLITHSGDDAEGDRSEEEELLDNEVVQVELNALHPDVHQIFFLLNSKSNDREGLSALPYTKIRAYLGRPNRVESLLHEHDLSADTFTNSKDAIIIGKLMRSEEGWDFWSLHHVVDAERLLASVDYVQKKLL